MSPQGDTALAQVDIHVMCLALQVSGTVTILDDHTFEIKNFNYNGTAPQTHFWAAKSTKMADLL